MSPSPVEIYLHRNHRADVSAPAETRARQGCGRAPG